MNTWSVTVVLFSLGFRVSDTGVNKWGRGVYYRWFSGWRIHLLPRRCITLNGFQDKVVNRDIAKESVCINPCQIKNQTNFFFQFLTTLFPPQWIDPVTVQWTPTWTSTPSPTFPSSSLEYFLIFFRDILQEPECYPATHPKSSTAKLRRHRSWRQVLAMGNVAPSVRFTHSTSQTDLPSKTNLTCTGACT